MTNRRDESRIVNLLQRLDTALLAEIAVIREGRFDDLSAVQTDTAEAMRQLDGLRSDLSNPDLDRAGVEAAMAGVKRRAEQARGLIGAALNGARDARRRLEDMVRADGRIGAYDRSGGQVMMKNIGSPYNKTI